MFKNAHVPFRPRTHAPTHPCAHHKAFTSRQTHIYIHTIQHLQYPREALQYPREALQYPREALQYPREALQYPREALQYPREALQYPREALQYPREALQFCACIGNICPGI